MSQFGDSSDHPQPVIEPSNGGAASVDLTTKRSSTRPHVKSRDASHSQKQPRTAQAGTKQDLVIQMLGRQSGVSVDDIVAKTSWQPHSVRGFLSGVVRKQFGLPLISEAGKDGLRRYHIAPIASAKA